LAGEWWLQLLGVLRQLGKLIGTALLVRAIAAALAGALCHRVGEAEERFPALAVRGGRCSHVAACDPSMEDELHAFAIRRSVQHASWLDTYVRGELRTGPCCACMEVAAVAIAVDRSTVNGSRARHRSKISLLTC
jgi:hypothetical protein